MGCILIIAPIRRLSNLNLSVTIVFYENLNRWGFSYLEHYTALVLQYDRLLQIGEIFSTLFTERTGRR